MKSAGLLSLCTAIALTGFYLAFLQNRKIRLLKELSAFFSDMGEMGKTGLWDFREILERLYPKYKGLTFVGSVIANYDCGENLKEIWEQETGNFCPLYISAEMKKLLSSFADVFGRCSREGFVKRCRDFSDIAEGLLASEEKRYEKNRTVTVYSGVLAAAAIFFIFI